MISFALLLLGLVLLIGGGALLVRGASDLAGRFGISPMVVGLTIVGFGTSTPELVVNAVSAMKGATGLAFGNVVGSNITNFALVLGAAALLAPIKIQGKLVRREIPLLLLITTVAMVISLDGVFDGRPPIIGRSDSTILVLLFLIFLYVNVLDFIQTRHKDALLTDMESSPLVATDSAGRFHWLMALAGIVLLYFGGDMTVKNALVLAQLFEVSPTVIGLFVVAIGTSLPEFVTSIVAVMRGELDLALGNVVGSNLFNTLVVLPMSGLIVPIPVPVGGATDLAVSLGLVAVLIPAFLLGKARLGRMAGLALVTFYAAYVFFRI